MVYGPILKFGVKIDIFQLYSLILKSVALTLFKVTGLRESQKWYHSLIKLMSWLLNFTQCSIKKPFSNFMKKDRTVGLCLDTNSIQLYVCKVFI